MERINAHKRVKRQDEGTTKAKAETGGATKQAGTGGTGGQGTSSASDLIVYFPIYIVSLAVLQQN